MTGTYRPPELLDASHDLDGFGCRSVEQTEWLLRHARASVGTGTTRVLVVTPADSDVVVAYYAWCMASVSLADAPPRMRKGAGRYPQPVALLARLGVDLQHEGRGLGAGLLKDVIARTLALGEEIGCRGLLVHAVTTEAREFYRHLVPEFEASPTDELHLFLLMKDIRRTLT
ncbi:GNAT family N-acetyltransferase [Iamia sp. SCSIO 61187]|nr:GNAT family N-acetyltransferase [Iamia sp. SCSIO 61187]